MKKIIIPLLCCFLLCSSRLLSQISSDVIRDLRIALANAYGIDPSRLTIQSSTTPSTSAVNFPVSYLAWHKVNGAAKDIGVGANGTVWVIGTSGSIWRWRADTWELISGAAERIAVDTSGNAWIVNSGGQIYRYNSTGNNWTLLSGQAKDIGIGANGTVWITGRDNSISRWTGTTWTKMPGAATRIAVDNEGKAWVVNSTGQIYKYNGIGYDLLPGRARDIGVGKNKVWMAGTDGMAYAWSNGNWVRMGGGYLSNISVGNTDMPWGITTDSTIYESYLFTTSLTSPSDTSLPRVGLAITTIYNGDSLIRPSVSQQPFELILANTSISLPGDSGIPINYSELGVGPLSPILLTFIQGGGYVAYFEIRWKDASGQDKTYNSGDVALGWKYTLSIPGSSTNLSIKAYNYTGLIWEPKKIVFSQTYTIPSTMCMKIYNTTLNPYWNNDCN